MQVIYLTNLQGKENGAMITFRNRGVHNMLDWEMLSRLAIAAILGLTIGLEREYKGKPLGLKTCLVISITSCLLTIVSIQSAYLFPDSEFVMIRMDPLRLAAQIVSGVGFLGAGVILRREDDTISGLTTAAIVWGAAGVGIATGAGFYIEAVSGVVLLIVSVELIPLLINRMNIKYLNTKELSLKIYVTDRTEIPIIISNIEKEVNEVKKVRLKNNKEKSHQITLKVTINENINVSAFYMKISDMEKINGLDING